MYTENIVKALHHLIYADFYTWSELFITYFVFYFFGKRHNYWEFSKLIKRSKVYQITVLYVSFVLCWLMFVFGKEFWEEADFTQLHSTALQPVEAGL